MFQNQNEYQKDFANYWYTERAKNPKYSDQIGGDKLNSVLSNIDKATWKTPTEAMRDNMVGQGYNPTDAQINQQLNILKEKGTKGFANPKAHSYTSLRPTNTWHEGVGHMVGDNTPAILNATPNVRISNSDSSYEDYVNQANEKHAQTWDFRGNNSNLKDDQGNYYIDPNTDKLTKYYSKPTEQKAYMNQLREFMYANKMIDTRDQIVTPDLIKQAISKLPKGMQSIKKASEQFKSMRSYTKWFNTYHYLEQERQEQINILQAMKTETDRKLYTYVTGVNTLDKYKEEHSYHYLPDVIMPPSQDSYNIEDILSEDQINAIKLFEDKKYFTQEEAHEVIEFLIRRCYELGATKNY